MSLFSAQIQRAVNLSLSRQLPFVFTSGVVQGHTLFLLALFLLYTSMPAPQFFISLTHARTHARTQNYLNTTALVAAGSVQLTHGTTAAPGVHAWAWIMEYISVLIESLRHPFKYPQRSHLYIFIWEPKSHLSMDMPVVCALWPKKELVPPLWMSYLLSGSGSSA